MRSAPLPDAFASDPHARRIERNSTEGISGVVNELLIQLQSFDTPTGGHRFRGWWIDSIEVARLNAASGVTLPFLKK